MDECAPATRRSLRAARADASASAQTEHRDGDVSASVIDEFEAAARLFSFTGETPVIASAPAEAAGAKVEQPSTAVHLGSRRSRLQRAVFARVAAGALSVGAMGVVGLLAVGMTTPVSAVAAAEGVENVEASLAARAGDVADAEPEEVQAYVVSSEASAAPVDRAETYATATRAQIASESGIANFSDFYVNNPNSPIQWPFAVGVSISYGFGMRDGRMHEGADFTPGEGSPIQAIADGIVRESTDSGGAYGVSIIIDHVIDGQLISSHYAHMQYGSRQVQVGDHVTVGTVIGHTGNTGRSFGAHTHFEILANGTTPIDPIPWLRSHAGG